MSKPTQEAPKGEIYYLEDIMKEFGGWSKEPAPSAEPTQVEEPTTVIPLPSLEEPTAPLPAAPTDKLPKFQIIPLEEADKTSPPPAKIIPLPTKAEPQKKPKKSPKPPKAPKVIPATTVEEANAALVKSSGLRHRLVAFLAILTTAITLAHGLDVPMGFLSADTNHLPLILLGVMLISICLALDVMKDGIFHLLSGKFNLDCLLAVAIAVFVLEGFITVEQNKLPYAAITTLGLWWGLSAKNLEHRSKKRIYKGITSLKEEPFSVLVSPDVVDNFQGVFKEPGSSAHLVSNLEEDSLPDQYLGIYALLAILLSLIISLTLYIWKDTSFLTTWAAILGGALPISGLLSFWRPFHRATVRLAKNGSVLCGWTGIQSLGQKPKLIVTDEDLFSGNQVSVNGMKIFASLPVNQVVGYANAVIQAGGGGLAPVFAALSKEHSGRNYTINQFKRYDSGGLGAEIQADVVLVGSMSFMQLMGVKMVEGTTLRQAVYCAINGDLVAVFALHYIPSAMVKTALHQAVRSGGAGLILANKDFILTPAAVRHFYKIPTGWMEFPHAKARADLAEGRLAVGQEVALMARDSFPAMIEVAQVGKQTSNQIKISTYLCLLWGTAGLAVTTVVAFLGAAQVVTAFNLTVFALLWSLANWLLVALQRKV